MQELAYSTYCSLKYPSGQRYLFQESHFTYSVADLSWVDKITGIYNLRNAFGTLASWRSTQKNIPL